MRCSNLVYRFFNLTPFFHCNVIFYNDCDHLLRLSQLFYHCVTCSIFLVHNVLTWIKIEKNLAHKRFLYYSTTIFWWFFILPIMMLHLNISRYRYFSFSCTLFFLFLIYFILYLLIKLEFLFIKFFLIITEMAYAETLIRHYKNFIQRTQKVVTI